MIACEKPCNPTSARCGLASPHGSSMGHAGTAKPPCIARTPPPAQAARPSLNRQPGPNNNHRPVPHPGAREGAHPPRATRRCKELLPNDTVSSFGASLRTDEPAIKSFQTAKRRPWLTQTITRRTALAAKTTDRGPCSLPGVGNKALTQSSVATPDIEGHVQGLLGIHPGRSSVLPH